MKEYVSLQKVYRVSRKNSAPRIWLQSLVCEAAGFVKEQELYVDV
jgi:DNA (cytosine-5)-methyltransferase 1